jgi:hypothetical protein
VSKKLTFEEVKQYFEDHNCELLETEYINCKTKMKYKCICGNSNYKITFDHFKRGKKCNECHGGVKFTYKYVYNYFKEHDCELLEKEYKNAHTLMKYRCNCGNISEIKFYSFKQGHRCKKCYFKRNSGENNHSYNPNLTDEEREKGRICPGIGKWKKNIYKKDNYTCQKCFKKEDIIKCAHHIEDYSNNRELRTIVSNGITLCKEHHEEFHKKYGYRCNREQLNEFLKNIT